MNRLLCKHISNLKSALLSLPATGEAGFEGLIGETLSEISGVPFRLASSGSQFGIDGESAFKGDAICFECKRYKDKVHRNEVISKIAELSINDTETEIWVLGATSQIKNQLANDARRLGVKEGIAILILDWSEIDLPSLAVALAMGGMRVQEFLKSNIKDKKALQKSISALKVVRNTQDFAIRSEQIGAQCNEPAVGLAIAQKANVDWLNNAFSNRNRARIIFGQPLSPSDKNTASVLQRKSLIDNLYPYLTSTLNEGVVFILGGEGYGKSWIVAQSWLTLEYKPLMLFISSDDFSENAGQNDVDELIISQLIKQTGDDVTETTWKRWRRRLSKWKSRPATDCPRLIVVIDGINQRPKSNWARIIGRISNELNQLGGHLIITARTPYFQARIKGGLTVQFTEVHVPEWSEKERDEILISHGIKPLDLYQAVARSLRNPRLLGIALELLDKADITNFEELSVSRLLFEHMRMSERDAPIPQSAQEFARQLQKHAQEIISRVQSNQHDDLNIFDDNIEAVADGRFFQAVDGDPTRYSLKDDGLTLALSFCLIDRLRKAQRNDRNIDDELVAILEPIAALDNTADVILAALTVTTIDERYERNIASVLIKGFATLQNPDQTQFPTFSGLAKKRPQGFMDAARVLSLSGGHQPNFDWIQGALTVAGRNSCSWQEMIYEVHSWLSVYSLSPERGTFFYPSCELQDKVKEEREKNKKKIKEKLHALSAVEQGILNNLQKENGDLSNLSHLAILLLAGKSLAPFAKSFLNWSFSNALNSDHTAPYKDFRDLVHLNLVDWSQTRAAILKESSPLCHTGVSETGKWALVNILRATGNSEDGSEALSLEQNLTKNQPHFKGWRRVEDYCKTDPCDPASKQPENLKRTSEQYAALDVSKLRQSVGQTIEDYFFEKARPGIARFYPEVAIAKYKEFVTDVLSHTGALLRQGLFELHKHNSLLTIIEARELIKKLNEVKTGGVLSGLSERDTWIISQYCMLLAFPFLNAHEQTKVLLSNESGESLLLALMKITKPLNEKEFENLIGTACSQNNERMQYLLLVLAKHTSVKLSTNAISQIAALFRSESERVRVQTLGVISQNGDEKLLSEVAKSDWKAKDIDEKNDFEDWYGSVALLKAATKGLIVHNEVLKRISARLYGWAATILDKSAINTIAHRIDVSIKKSIDLDDDLVAPDIEIEIHPSTPNEPSMFSVSERSSETKDIKEVFVQLSESKVAFEQRQRSSHDAFLEFKANLTHEKARIILDHLSLQEFTSLVESSTEISNRWYELFSNISRAKLPPIHNLVLLLAHALGKNAPEKAENLFRQVKNNKPLVSFICGKAGVPFDTIATWAGVRNPILDKLRFERLDQVGTDQDLSLEVLAALSEGKQELLIEYINEKLLKEEPSEISRGIMVAGFSDQSEFNEEILNRFKGNAGLIGCAQKAAKYAYERNIWARHWFEEMCLTDENSSFWCYSILFLKIVDGRFSIWHSKYPKKSKPIQLFGSTLDDSVKSRFEHWKNNRNKKLFGLDAPAPIFLQGTDDSY